MSLDQTEKAPDAYRTISEVAEDLDVPQHVLRFWETRFSQIRPLKRGGGRRYYRPDDVALIKGIRALLYGQGYTIKGVQRILKDHGVKQVQALARGEPMPAPVPPSLDEALAAGEPAAEMEMDGAGDGAAPLASAAPGLTADARRRLEAALAELSACRRLVDAARDPS